VVEDGVFVGALSGVFEGVRVGRGALIAAGVMLTSSTPIADMVNEDWIRADEHGVLSVPPGAVIVPGARPARGSFAADHGIQLQTPVLIRYRHAGGKEPIRLEEALR
jgi:2,3,4,5-tetrahydropyridine-2-carboxylate N-succinyltransferase